MKNKPVEIHNVNIATLIPADYNPRRLSKAQFEDIKNSIERFGFVDPVIVNKHPDRKNIIVGGHQRVKVAIKLGYKFVPVVYVDLDLAQERELNVRLNKNSGEFDFDLLANYFDTAELIDWGFTERELGLGQDEPENTLDDTDDESQDDDLVIKIPCATLLQYNRVRNLLEAEGIDYKTAA